MRVTDWQEQIVKGGRGQGLFQSGLSLGFWSLAAVADNATAFFSCRPARCASPPGAGTHHPCLKLQLHTAAPRSESVISMQMPCAAQGC